MNALSPKEELAFYKAQLKSNEAVIASLTKDNKHIKDHVKFLEAQLKPVAEPMSDADYQRFTVGAQSEGEGQ